LLSGLFNHHNKCGCGCEVAAPSCGCSG
jgi:hypothetical protein